MRNNTLDTSGNLAFGTSDGSSVATDRYVIRATGENEFITDVSMNSTLDVEGKVTLKTKLDVMGDVSMNSMVAIGGDASLNSKLFVKDHATFDSTLITNSDISANQHLYVAGDVSFNSNLFVMGDVELESTLLVNNKTLLQGDVSMDSVLAVGGDASLNSKLFVAQDVSMDSVLAVGGDARLNSKLFVAHDVSMDSMVAIGGDASLNSKLFVKDHATFDSTMITNSDISANQHLYVAGDVSFNSNLFVSGDISINNNIKVGGSISVSELTVSDNVDITSGLIVRSDVSMDMALMVGGDVSLNSQLVVDGNVSLNSNLTVTQNADFHSNTHFLDDVSMHSVLAVGGDVSLNSKLYVVGDVSMDSGLNVNTLHVDNKITATDLSINNDLIVWKSVVIGNEDTSNNEVLIVKGRIQAEDLILSSTDQGVLITTTKVGSIVLGPNKVESQRPTITTNADSDTGNTTLIIKTNEDERLRIDGDGKTTFYNDVSMNTSLMVGGDVSLNSKLFVANDVSMDSVLAVGGDVTMNSTLDVVGDVSMDSVLAVGGDVTMNSKLDVVGNVSMDSALAVGGDVSLNSKLDVVGDVSMDSVLAVGGDVTMNSKLDVVGDVSMDSVLAVGGDVTMNSKLDIGGDVSMDSALACGGDVSMNSKLDVVGDVTMNSKLDVVGDVSMDTLLMVGGDVSLNSKLFVADDVSLNSNVTISGDLQIYGKLDVNQIQNTNTINTTVNEYTLVVTEDLSINGGLSVSEDLSLNGNANISNKLIVDKDGDVTIKNKNLIIGDSVYLSTMVANSIFDGFLTDGKPTYEGIFIDKTYTISSSSYNGVSSVYSVASAFVNNAFAWTSIEEDKKYSKVDGTTSFTYEGTDFVTNYDGNYDISGEWIQLELPSITIIESFEIHTGFYQVPTKGLLLAEIPTTNGPKWEKIATYSKNESSESLVQNKAFLIECDKSLETTKVRFVVSHIDKRTNTDSVTTEVVSDTGEITTVKVYGHNVAIRYINFSGTVKNEGISVGAGYSQNTANTSIGFGTLAGNINGKNNIALGNYTLSQTTTSDNVAIGYNSLVNNIVGIQNIAIGSDTQLNNTTGSKNITIGHTSGYSNSEGTGNTFIGDNAGYFNRDGSSNTFIGRNTGGTGDFSHSTAIGADSIVTEDNQIVIGTTDDNVKIPGTIELSGIFNGDVSFNDNVDVKGATTLTSLTVAGNGQFKTLTVDSTSLFSSNITTTAELDVQSSIKVSNAAILSSTLKVFNAATLSSTLSVSNATSLSSTLSVDGDTSLRSRLVVTGDVSLNHDVTIQNLDITGNATFDKLDVTGATTIGDTFTTTGNILFNGPDGPKLSITTDVTNNTTSLINDIINVGTTTKENFVTINNIDGTSKMIINGTTGVTALSVTGTIEGTDVRITGGGTIQTTGDVITTSIRTLIGDVSSGMALQPTNYGDIANTDTPPPATGLQFIPQLGIDTNNDPILDAGGIVQIDSSGNMTIKRNLKVGRDTSLNSLHVNSASTLSTLSVINETTLSSTLDVSGASTMGNTLNVSGASTMGNTLNVINATTLYSTLAVSKATTLSSTLNVSGSTLFDDTLTVTKETYLNSHVDISGNVSITHGPFTVNDISFGVDNLPTSVTGDFDSNQKRVYSQYSGMERVFNGLYDISASSFAIGYEPWKAFDLSNGTIWNSSGDTYVDQTDTDSITYKVPNSNAATTQYYTPDNTPDDVKGEWIEITLPYYVRLNSISLAANDNNTNNTHTIERFTVLGTKDNSFKLLYDNIDANITDTQGIQTFVVTDSFYTNRIRIIIRKYDGTNTYAMVSSIRFNGDVLGSKVHIDDGNMGIGTVNPRSALEVTGDMVLSNAISGGNTSGNSVEHGRIVWAGIGRDVSNNNHSSYIRSYFEKQYARYLWKPRIWNERWNNHRGRQIYYQIYWRTSFYYRRFYGLYSCSKWGCQSQLYVVCFQSVHHG